MIRKALFRLFLKWVSNDDILDLSITNEARPLNKMGAPKTNSDLIDAKRLVLFWSPEPANLRIAVAFLWAEMRSIIWGVIEEESRTMPTWSAECERGINLLEIVMGVRVDSIWGI